MLAKTEYDRQGLRTIGGIVATVLARLVAAAKPGVTTAQLDRLAGDALRELGAEATPRKEYGFPGRLCISVNDEVVHGIPGRRVLAPGDLVKFDLTADRRGYVADATRMALLSPADPDAVRLAEGARDICHAAVRTARAGIRLEDLGRFIEAAARDRGFAVFREFCGHGVGRHTHEEPEVPNYPDARNRTVLRKGMVIAIEPILAAGQPAAKRQADGWTMVTTDGALAAHYEETVIIGRDGAEIVTVPAEAHAQKNKAL
ncbi:MAG: type I methionyl aminopeptidase [Planctomycetaceae bacterium]|nr:type I methionyl aminopeptidase [Planctomycetaceae bacterium]